MRRGFLILAGSIVLSASITAFAEPVAVLFYHPETCSDAALRSGSRQEGKQLVLSELRQYIKHLGVRYVPPQQALAIEIVDIDLAGQFEPWRGPAYDARVIRDVFPPRILLRYRLSEDGQVVAPDQEQVTDFNYLSNAAAMRSSDPLRYEKAMLADRFRRRFVSRQSGPT